MVMEHLQGGDVYERVVSRGRLPEAEAASTLRQVFEAIKYLHDLGVMHRDLKLENFVYERDDANAVKLVDFGFAAKCGPEEKLDMVCGTLDMVAPEVLEGCYDLRADIWSLGVAAYMMLVGSSPWGHTETATRQMIEHAEPNFDQGFFELSDQAQDFVKSLLVRNPAMRPSAALALRHPFLESAMECHQSMKFQRMLLRVPDDLGIPVSRRHVPAADSLACCVATQRRRSRSPKRLLMQTAIRRARRRLHHRLK
jgi:calcium-dependent protein kinase